jgi:transketolase
MRNAFIDELVAQAQVDPRIALVVGDLGFSVVEPFADRFPDRFINAGVAEQDMMGLAAGLASEGFHPFVYSIANFPLFRCAEQIRNDVDYHNLPVTIIAVGGGLAYGALGYSHHAVQDYGLIRLMPNMLIAAPGDPMEVRACMRYLTAHPQPSYLRLGKAGEPRLHRDVPAVAPGQWLHVAGPHDGAGTLLTTGAPLPLAASWLGRREYEGFALHSLPIWGMQCKVAQPSQASAWRRIVTVEDHITDAGFGSWLTEACLGQIGETAIAITALSSGIFGKVGSQATLNALGGLR